MIAGRQVGGQICSTMERIYFYEMASIGGGRKRQGAKRGFQLSMQSSHTLSHLRHYKAFNLLLVFKTELCPIWRGGRGGGEDGDSQPGQ